MGNPQCQEFSIRTEITRFKEGRNRAYARNTTPCFPKLHHTLHCFTHQWQWFLLHGGLWLSRSNYKNDKVKSTTPCFPELHFLTFCSTSIRFMTFVPNVSRFGDSAIFLSTGVFFLKSRTYWHGVWPKHWNYVVTQCYNHSQSWSHDEKKVENRETFSTIDFHNREDNGSPLVILKSKLALFEPHLSPLTTKWKLYILTRTSDLSFSVWTLKPFSVWNELSTVTVTHDSVNMATQSPLKAILPVRLEVNTKPTHELKAPHLAGFLCAVHNESFR